MEFDRNQGGLMQGAEDWGFWRWVGTILFSAICGLVGGTWWTRGKVAEIDDINRRLKIVEGRCAAQKQEIIEMIRSEVRSEIRLAISEHSTNIVERLGDITSTLSGMSAHLEEARLDIVALFDRRRVNREESPHRRNTDGHDNHGERGE